MVKQIARVCLVWWVIGSKGNPKQAIIKEVMPSSPIIMLEALHIHPIP